MSRAARIASRQSGDVWVLDLPQDLGADVESPLLEAAQPALDAAPRALVLDFARVAYANSAGVGALVLLVQRAMKHGVPVRCAGVDGQPRVILDRVGLARYASFHPTVAAATAAEAG